jgi:hypothetical protein
MKFNLARHLGLTKEAMAAPQFKNRDTLDFWSLEQLENAADNQHDPDIIRWNEWVEAVPNLKGVIPTARAWRDNYLDKMKKEHKLPYEVGNKILKLYIGFEPKSGAYIAFVGPYFSKGFIWGQEHAREGALGKFIATTLCFAPMGVRGAQTAINKKVELLNKGSAKVQGFSQTSQGNPTGIEFDEGDFSLVKRMPKQQTEDGKWVKGGVLQEVENVQDIRPLIPNPQNDPNITQQNEQIRQANMEANPDAYNMLANPNIHTDVEIKLNVNGYEKLMKNLMGPFFEDTIKEYTEAIRKENPNMTEEEAKASVVNKYSQDRTALENFYTQVRKKWERASKNPQDPRYLWIVERNGLGYPVPPTFKDPGLSKVAGQVHPREVRPTDALKNVLNKRKQIAELIANGITDVNEIDAVINDGLRDKDKLPADKIANEIDKIADIRVSLQAEGKEGTLDEVIAKITSHLEGLTAHGYRDWMTAFEMLVAHFASPPTLQIGEKNEFQSKDIDTIKDLQEEIEEIGEGRIEAPEEIEVEVPEGDVPVAEQARVEVAPEEAQPVQPAQPVQRAQPAQPVQYEEEDEIDEELADIIGYTLKNLIKVARELDDEGKGNAAEEVHKVIRKYQKRIL